MEMESTKKSLSLKKADSTLYGKASFYSCAVHGK
ncbi:hypothetical protein EZS27_009605 [termite gut metagenome]|uniref:Uncharacterized protein n=1 Tax=termite gut metagenome TaxID=433724 RepID=A0A5J4S9U3_9ZZZZ